MRLLPIAATLLLFLPSIHAEKPLEKNGIADKKTSGGQTNEANKSGENSTINTTLDTNTSTDKCADRNQQTNPPVYSVKVVSQPRDPWYVAYIFLTLAATIVNGIIAYSVWKQGGHMEQGLKTAHDTACAARDNATAAVLAAGAAKTSADAATKQYKAWISAERARLDLDLTLWDAELFYQVMASNSGRSEARVTLVKFTRSYYAPEVTELPAHAMAEFTQQVTMNNLLDKGAKRRELFRFNLAHFLSDDDREGKRTAIVTLAVEYFDIFEKPHVTEVVYSYKRSENRLVNLGQYTRYT